MLDLRPRYAWLNPNEEISVSPHGLGDIEPDHVCEIVSFSLKDLSDLINDLVELQEEFREEIG